MGSLFVLGSGWDERSSRRVDLLAQTELWPVRGWIVHVPWPGLATHLEIRLYRSLLALPSSLDVKMARAPPYEHYLVYSWCAWNVSEFPGRQSRLAEWEHHQGHRRRFVNFFATHRHSYVLPEPPGLRICVRVPAAGEFCHSTEPRIVFFPSVRRHHDNHCHCRFVSTTWTFSDVDRRQNLGDPGRHRAIKNHHRRSDVLWCRPSPR